MGSKFNITLMFYGFFGARVLGYFEGNWGEKGKAIQGIKNHPCSLNFDEKTLIFNNVR